FLLAAIPMVLPAQSSYRLQVIRTDADSSASLSFLNIPESFTSRDRCLTFINEMPLLLRAQGYVTASLDKVQMDSLQAQVWLYLGEKYAWAKVDASQVDKQILESTGWRDQAFENRPLDFEAVKDWQNKMLNWLENNGHPFAKVWLDSVRLT